MTSFPCTVPDNDFQFLVGKFSLLNHKLKAIQSCLTLCNPMDYTVHGILQARILEWVSLPPSPGYLLNPGIKPVSPALQGDSLPLNHLESPNYALQTAKSVASQILRYLHVGPAGQA